MVKSGTQRNQLNGKHPIHRKPEPEAAAVEKARLQPTIIAEPEEPEGGEARRRSTVVAVQAGSEAQTCEVGVAAEAAQKAEEHVHEDDARVF